VIAVEDLFDLNYTQLNKIYKSLRKQQGDVEDSLIEKATAEDTELTLKVNLVKDVYDTKKEAADKRKAADKKRQQKERIMEIIAAKQDEKLADMTEEELMAMLDD